MIQRGAKRINFCILSPNVKNDKNHDLRSSRRRVMINYYKATEIMIQRGLERINFGILPPIRKNNKNHDLRHADIKSFK